MEAGLAAAKVEVAAPTGARAAGMEEAANTEAVAAQLEVEEVVEESEEARGCRSKQGCSRVVAAACTWQSWSHRHRTSRCTF